MSASTPTIDTRNSGSRGTNAGSVPPAPAAATATKANVKEQVSFIIQHKVKPNHHEQYEEWLHHIITEAGKFPGHLGAHVVRPRPGGDLYEISVRFASREDAMRWMNSQERHDLVQAVMKHISEPEHLDIKSGVDYWFTEATNGKSPPVWKQWLTTVSVIWPLSLIIPVLMRHLYALVPVLGTWGIAQLLSAMVTVGLLVYVIMPRYTKAIKGWLTK